jgi:hypothetical protein
MFNKVVVGRDKGLAEKGAFPGGRAAAAAVAAAAAAATGAPRARQER